MGIHYRLPALRLVAAGGPVTRALAVMTAADPETARIRALRRSIAQRIEADIALLDALSGDADLEADFCTTELASNGRIVSVGRSTDDEPSLCGVGSHERNGNWPEYPQDVWRLRGADQHDIEGDDSDREDGGDDEDSHDAEGITDDNGIADQHGLEEQFAFSSMCLCGAA